MEHEEAVGRSRSAASFSRLRLSESVAADHLSRLLTCRASVAIAQQRARDIFDRTFANPLPGYRTALVISHNADQREAMLAGDWN